MTGKIEEFRENGETLEEGLSNSVYASEERILKVYTLFPFTSLYATFLEIFTGKLTYVSREDRMETEERIQEDIRGSGLGSPEIFERGKDYIVFEKVPGKSGYEYLNTCSQEEAKEFGEKVRGFHEKLHEQGKSLRDSRVSNFMVGEEIYSIDHEYASLSSNRLFDFIDELTVVSSARQTAMYYGFIHGYGPGIPARFLSVFMAFYHTVVFERSPKRLKRIFESLRIDLLGPI